MSFKSQKKPASIVKRMALLHQQITHEMYAKAITTVVQEILDRPPNHPGLAPGQPISPIAIGRA